MLYVRNNEHTNRLKVVTVVEDEKDVPARMAKDLKFLDEAYPDIDIEFVVQKGEFGPKLVKQLSKERNIPTNFMFIASPGDHFLYGLAELGGDDHLTPPPIGRGASIRATGADPRG